MSENPFKKIWY